MPSYNIQSRETWTVLVDYSIEAESLEEAEEVVDYENRLNGVRTPKINSAP
jgi:hypothetical protein